MSVFSRRRYGASDAELRVLNTRIGVAQQSAPAPISPPSTTQSGRDGVKSSIEQTRYVRCADRLFALADLCTLSPPVLIGGSLLDAIAQMRDEATRAHDDPSDYFDTQMLLRLIAELRAMTVALGVTTADTS